MNKKIMKILSGLTCTALALASLAGCGEDSSQITLDALLEANALSSILSNGHTSVLETTTYYEGLDTVGTFETISAYVSYTDAEDDSYGSTGSYITKGSELVPAEASAGAEDGAQASGTGDTTGSTGYTYVSSAIDTGNYSWYISDNVEYYLKTDGTVVVYPLTRSYMNDFMANAFDMEELTDEKVESVQYDGEMVTANFDVEASSYFTDDTLAAIETLAGSSVVTVRYTYTADASTLELTDKKVSYVTESGTALLFSESSIRYDVSDDDIPSADFAVPYMVSDTNRSITVVENENGQTIIDSFTLPSTVSPDLKCFTDAGYVLYTDETETTEFTGEYPGDGGLYPDITLYAKMSPEDDDGDSNSSNSSAQ